MINNKNMKTYRNTDIGNGFEGVEINETIENEISKRTSRLDEMHSTSNWTSEMEKEEEKLNKEVQDLIQGRGY